MVGCFTGLFLHWNTGEWNCNLATAILGNKEQIYNFKVLLNGEGNGPWINNYAKIKLNDKIASFCIHIQIW